MLRKNGADTLPPCRVAINVQFVKKKTYKKSTICKSTIKPGMPIFLAVLICKSTQSGHRWELSLRMYVSILSVLLKLIHLQTETDFCKVQDAQGHYRPTTGMWAPNPSEESKAKGNSKKTWLWLILPFSHQNITWIISMVINVFYQLPMDSVSSMSKFTFLTQRH